MMPRSMKIIKRPGPGLHRTLNPLSGSTRKAEVIDIRVRIMRSIPSFCRFTRLGRGPYSGRAAGCQGNDGNGPEYRGSMERASAPAELGAGASVTV